MAFHDYRAERTRMPEVGTEQRPDLPLSLELVPPVLCHSFGIPMHDAYFLPQAGMYSPYDTDSLRHRGEGPVQHSNQFTGQFLGDRPQMPYNMSNMGYGQMHSDVNFQLGFSQQPRMYYNHRYPQHPQPLPYQPAAMYNPGMYHTQHMPESPGVDMGIHGNGLGMRGFDTLAQAVRDESHGVGLKRSASVLNTEQGSLPCSQTPLEAVPLKRSRLVWTTELHLRFQEAVEQAGGIEQAVPKVVLECMNVDGLTRDNVASHLQKHRIQLRKAGFDPAPHGISKAQSNLQTGAPCVTSARTVKDTVGDSQPASKQNTETRGDESTTGHASAQDTSTNHKCHGSPSPPQDGTNPGQGESSGNAFTCGSGSDKTTVLCTHILPSGIASNHKVLPSVHALVVEPVATDVIIYTPDTATKQRSNGASGYTIGESRGGSNGTSNEVTADDGQGCLKVLEHQGDMSGNNSDQSASGTQAEREQG